MKRRATQLRIIDTFNALVTKVELGVTPTQLLVTLQPKEDRESIQLTFHINAGDRLIEARNAQKVLAISMREKAAYTEKHHRGCFAQPS
jgi:hypothetical protein